MSWLDAIAGVAGATEGWQRGKDQQRASDVENAKLLSAQQLQELKNAFTQNIQSLKEDRTDQRLTQLEGGRNARNTENNTARSTIADNSNATRTSINDTNEGGRNTRAGNALTESARQADQRNDLGWAADDRGWSLGQQGINTRNRAIDVGAATATRGQDLQHDVATDSAAATTADRKMRYALGAYNAETARKRGANGLTADPNTPEPSFDEWLKTTNDPEVFPSVAARANGAQSPALPAMDTPAGAPAAPLPAPRPTAPVAPRPAAAAPAGAPAKAASPVPGRPSAAAAPAIPAETQARTLIAQIQQQEGAGKDATALRQQLAALRAQVK